MFCAVLDQQFITLKTFLYFSYRTSCVRSISINSAYGKGFFLNTEVYQTKPLVTMKFHRLYHVFDISCVLFQVHRIRQRLRRRVNYSNIESPLSELEHERLPHGISPGFVCENTPSGVIAYSKLRYFSHFFHSYFRFFHFKPSCSSFGQPLFFYIFV